MSKKISIITPSYNSGKHIEEAIRSVLNQEYDNFEHIVVDGGSDDNTPVILQKYPHVKWVSEPDKGQSHAMNKGFAMSSGDIIGYLNADDYYLPGAFMAVLHYFEEDANFVVGKVKVLLDDGSSWINDPKCTQWEMLHHWQPDAFCVNPAGYFYSRRVQEKVNGFNESNSRTMDLEFLLAASRDFEFTKINRLLGVFRLTRNAKTMLFREDEEIWTTEFFSYIDGFLDGLPPEKKRQFDKEREEGYLLRKKWQREQDQKIAAGERRLEEKVRLLQQKDQVIARKNGELDRKERQLEQKDQQIEEKDILLRQRDEQIEEKDRQLREKDKQIEEKDRQLRLKDQQAEQTDNRLRQQDEQIMQKVRQIEEKDMQLDNKDQQLREKDRLLQERDKKVADKVRELTGKTELLAKSNRDLQQVSRELGWKDARLKQVLNSKSFRVGKFLVSPFTLIKKIIRSGKRK